MGCSDREIRECIANGAKCLDSIEAACGAGGGCQTCHEDILSLLAEQSGCASVAPQGALSEQRELCYYRSTERSFDR